MALLLEQGASDDDATAIVDALTEAGLSASEMRAWLSHPMTAYVVNGRVPTHAIEDGRASDVIAAAREFAAASEDERYIARTLVCGLDAVERLTHGDPGRTAQVKQAAEMLVNKLRKPIAINEALQTTLSGDYEDQTRLIDWMLDDRLEKAVHGLEAGVIDPVELRAKGSLMMVGW
jgi:hypothetical protein